MRGHGAVIVGKNIIEAVARSVYLEVNARVQAQAMAMGQRVTYLDEGEVKKRTQDPDPTAAPGTSGSAKFGRGGASNKRRPHYAFKAAMNCSMESPALAIGAPKSSACHAGMIWDWMIWD